MLREVFNDLIFPTSPEGFNVFTWFNGHVHDGVKVIQYFMLHPIFFGFSSTKPLKRAMRKGKWSLDPCPTHS
jgi:hypothetical protein